MVDCRVNPPELLVQPSKGNSKPSPLSLDEIGRPENQRLLSPMDDVLHISYRVLHDKLGFLANLFRHAEIWVNLSILAVIAIRPLRLEESLLLFLVRAREISRTAREQRCPLTRVESYSRAEVTACWLLFQPLKART